MSSCLGIYLNNDIIKFAKLSGDPGKEIKLEQYGVRFIKTSKKEAINAIIEETNSKSIPVVINPQSLNFIPVQVFNQAQGKSYVADVIKMEFEAWCERNAKSLDKYSYVYKVSELKTPDNKHNGIIGIMDKKDMDEFTDATGTKITNMFPPQLLINRLVPEEEINYILVNLDDHLTVSTIINGKVYDYKSFEVGMQKILSEFSLKLGTYQKAYEACKQLNVFSEGETNNDKTLEIIVEPIFHEILEDVLAILTTYRKDVTKVILTGTGVLFTNIDILFREFLDIKCEILKPYFLSDTTDVRNMAEKLETTQAMTLAYEIINPLPANKELECMRKPIDIKKSFSGIMNIFKKNDNTIKKEEKTISSLNTITSIFNPEKLIAWLSGIAIVFGLVFVIYSVFTIIYSKEVDKMVANVDSQIKKLTTKSSEIDTDVNYIRSNTTQYKEVNDRVDGLIKQIENNQIGKFTTYNVASFLQNIIKVIPKNVQLQTISSDDNKNIKIVAKSKNYSDLGYFVAELKLESTLKNIKVTDVVNGEITVIEIGGELP